MDRPRRTSLATAVEDSLEKAIRCGEIGPEIPGYRELQRVLGVSRTVIEPAISSLIAKGLIEPAGPRRRHRVPRNIETRAESHAGRRVLLLEPNTMGERTPTATSFARLLRELPEAGDHEIQHLAVQADQSRASPGRWQQLLDASGADLLIVVSGHHATLSWAARCGVPALAFGGDLADLDLPFVSYSAADMVADALDHLFEKGMRDVCVPLGVRTHGFVARIRRTVAAAFERHGHPFVPRLHFPRWHANLPEAWTEGLRWRFGVARPDALVIMGAGPYRTTLGAIMEKRWSIPDDISLVAAADRAELSWFHPRPTCFDLDPAPLAIHAAKWLRDPAGTRPESGVRPTLIEGASVAPRMSP